MITYIHTYLIAINIVGILMMKVDKQRAIRHQFRIKEKTLWLIAFIGGSIGATIGMNLYRHKTKHLNFKWGLPFLALVEILLYIYFIKLS